MSTPANAGRVVVLDIVGLQRGHLRDAPNLRNLVTESEDGFEADLKPSFPALTVPVQTTLATGRPPAEHGDVSSGEFDRDSRTVTFWGRDRGERDRLWETASEAGLTTGVLFFQHLIGTSADVAMTPSPIEDEDNELLEMNCWSNPDEFYDEMEAEYGHFPLHRYWGPGAGAESSEWILSAATEAVERYDPDLLWVYVPHLDYDCQRAGPGSGAASTAVETVDDLVGDFLTDLRADDRWAETAVAVVSEYGFHPVDRPVFPNRILADAGRLAVGEDGDVELGDSDAFAMVDHQVAHVYADDSALDSLRTRFESLDGVDDVLGPSGKRDRNIDHPNAGDLVLVAEPSAWFQYYWWTDPGDRPPYATDVDIHEKPGFDPCELFFGDDGMVSTDAGQVGGSHGRVDPEAFGFFGLGGPAAPSAAVGETVDARAVAPTIAALLGAPDALDSEVDPVWRD